MSDFIKSNGSILLMKELENKVLLETGVNKEFLRLRIKEQSEASSGTKNFKFENLFMDLRLLYLLESVRGGIYKSAGWKGLGEGYH